MNIVNIINKKRLKEELTKEELEFAFLGYLNETIKDYQMSSLLMAICINGMTDEETFILTDIFLHSGDVLNFDSILGIKVDKHSTGGVGDKTTMILGPIVAACGVSVPKMSGRGLGHTGGTIDKLESIPGFKTNLTEEEFFNQVNTLGFAVTSQTKNLTPLDKKVYALRDVTGTTESLPLIASSIMSKKLAGGADKILIDIKVGSGALIKTMEDAEHLSNIMIKIGENYNHEVRTLITDMNNPLGRNIGNSLEVFEAYEILQNKGDLNLRRLCVELSSHMVSMGKNISYEEANKLVDEAITSGKALQKFFEFIKAQGGDISKLRVSDKRLEIKATKSGVIKAIDALKMGILSVNLGAGRKNKEDIINPEVGIVLNKVLNDKVQQGEVLCTLFLKEDDNNLYNEVVEYFTIEEA